MRMMLRTVRSRFFVLHLQTLSIKNTLFEHGASSLNLASRALSIAVQDMEVEGSHRVQEDIDYKLLSFQLQTNQSLEDWLLIVRVLGVRRFVDAHFLPMYFICYARPDLIVKESQEAVPFSYYHWLLYHGDKPEWPDSFHYPTMRSLEDWISDTVILVVERFMDPASASRCSFEDFRLTTRPFPLIVSVSNKFWKSEKSLVPAVSQLHHPRNPSSSTSSFSRQCSISFPTLRCLKLESSSPPKLFFASNFSQTSSRQGRERSFSISSFSKERILPSQSFNSSVVTNSSKVLY
ncbi:Uncharacterized protein Rs2_42773 [Raphanus sativus]|nr:Uncharacterized protein Rs2_42773 [Raphanus sativus]